MSGVAGPIRLVGCGTMGAALARGWLAAGLPASDLQIVEPVAAVRATWTARGAQTAAVIDDVARWPQPRALVLAVKPQQMRSVLPHAAALAGPSTLVLSIAAGTRLATLAAAFGGSAPVVRAMPNTPAAVGQGATALYAPGHVGTADRALADALMAAVGLTLWLDDEAQLHAVTALSGGGPAYVFLLVEVLAAAAAKCGLAPDVAMRLTRATVSGAAALLRQSTEPPEVLRKNVTSPGGTTAEALAVLMAGDGLQPMFDRAVAAAAARSEALGREFPS